MRGARIAAVGSSAEVSVLAGPETRHIDLAGRLVTPGFHDSHVHFAAGCLSLSRVNLRDAPDEAEFGRRLKEADAVLPHDAWLVGGRWDHDLTFSGSLPTAALIDKYVHDRPVFLRRYDGHMAVVNSLALRAAGVTGRTPDPPGGKIDRDAKTGQPTGILRDTAMDLVARRVPAPTTEDLVTAIPAGLKVAARMGITSVDDMMGNGAPCLEAYRKLEAEHELSLRVNLYWPLKSWEEAAELRQEFRGDHLRLRGVKAFVDGSLGSSTAWFHEPYACMPAYCGFPVVDMTELARQMEAADRAGLQLAVHAIGDRAVSELLSTWERLIEAHGPRDRRLRMEHAQHIRTQDLLRFERLGVIASVQPYHAIDDSRWMKDRLGELRCGEAFVFRSLLDAGVQLALGSDWPVAPLDVLAGIDAAVNRRSLDGRHPKGWHPEQRITVSEALRGYTEVAARAAFAECEVGTLTPNKFADLVVLDRDITHPGNRDAIAETRVALTMIGGKVVYSDASWASGKSIVSLGP